MRVRASQSAILLIILFTLMFSAFFYATGHSAAAADVASTSPRRGGRQNRREAGASASGQPLAATEIGKEFLWPTPVAGYSSLPADANEELPSPTPMAGHSLLLAKDDQQAQPAAELASQPGALVARSQHEEDQSGPVRERVRYYPIPAEPLAQATVVAGKLRVPILMYHHIADAPADADAVRRDLSVTPTNFARQMDYLLLNGYRPISLDNLLDSLLNSKPLPAKAVVLTFDDGYDDNYTLAYPILRRYGFTGTFFVLTDALGNPGYMTWQQTVDMDRNGMPIEPHGRTHENLAASSNERATWQIAGSRSILEERLGHKIRFYCYPSGHYTEQTIAILKASGYVAAVTIDYGATHNASAVFELKRVRIHGADTLEQFISKLTTAP